MPILGKAEVKMDQNWRLISCHGITSMFGKKPPGRVWGIKTFEKQKKSNDAFQNFFLKGGHISKNSFNGLF